MASLFNHLRELEEAGALRRTARYRESDGGRTSTLYVLAWAHPFVHVPDSPPEPELAKKESPDEANPTPPSRNLEGGPLSRNLEGGPPENRATPPPENWIPRTKPSYEQTPVVPIEAIDATEKPPARKRASTSKGASPPSDSPGSNFNHHHAQQRRPTPRELGTNPRALAAKAQAALEEQQRLDQARQYGLRMASVDPLPWTVEEFADVARESSRGDERWAQAALEAYVGATSAPETEKGPITSSPLGNRGDEGKYQFDWPTTPRDGTGQDGKIDLLAKAVRHRNLCAPMLPENMKNSARCSGWSGRPRAGSQ